MTNKELQDLLKQYLDDAEIIRYNVYQDMNAKWDGYEQVNKLSAIKYGEFRQLFSYYGGMIKGLFIKI